jgi:hypothetical protein
MLTLPRTWARKKLSNPKSLTADQLTVDISLSTLGVCPDLRTQSSLRGVCRSKTRRVTPGSCGGGAACATAGTAVTVIIAVNATRTSLFA